MTYEGPILVTNVHHRSIGIRTMSDLLKAAAFHMAVVTDVDLSRRLSIEVPESFR